MTAVEGGPDGNVEPGTIIDRPERRELVLPQGHQPAADQRRDQRGVQPRSPRPTSTGRSRRSTCPSRPAFQEAMDDPALEANGATVFPATGRLGEPTPDVVPDDPRRPGGRDVRTRPVGDGHGHRGRRGAGQRDRRDTDPGSGHARPRAGRRIDRGRGRRCHRHRPDGQLPGRCDRASRSRSSTPPSSRRWSSASRSRRRRAILAPFGQVALDVSPDWTGSVPGFESRVT